MLFKQKQMGLIKQKACWLSEIIILIKHNNALQESLFQPVIVIKIRLNARGSAAGKSRS
jgi:hypothetical protein